MLHRLVFLKDRHPVLTQRYQGYLAFELLQYGSTGFFERSSVFDLKTYGLRRFMVIGRYQRYAAVVPQVLLLGVYRNYLFARLSERDDLLQ